MFHHQSTPDVSQLPTGAYLVRRKLGSIEGHLVYDDTDTQVYRFKGHLAFPASGGAWWTALGRTWRTWCVLRCKCIRCSRCPDPGVPTSSYESRTSRRFASPGVSKGPKTATSTSRATLSIMKFTFEKDGQAVGTTTRRWISVADAYAVQVVGMDPVLAVAASVGIDFIEQERDR